jgi:hypothetical protein
MKNRTKAVAAGATLALVSAGLVAWAEPTPFATGGGCTSAGTREPLRFRAQDNENSPTEAVTFSGTVSINGGGPLLLNFIADTATIDVSPSLSGEAVATITATWPSDSRTVTVAIDFAACEIVTVPTTPTTEPTFPTPALFASGGGCTGADREPISLRAEVTGTVVPTFSGFVSINGGPAIEVDFNGDLAELDVAPDLSGEAEATITAMFPSGAIRTVTVSIDLETCELTPITTTTTTAPPSTPPTTTTPPPTPPTPPTPSPPSTPTPPNSSTPPASATPTPSPTPVALPPSANPTISDVPGYVDTDQDGTISPGDSQYAAAINSLRESG